METSGKTAKIRENESFTSQDVAAARMPLLLRMRQDAASTIECGKMPQLL
jgi:hypothetical protein